MNIPSNLSKFPISDIKVAQQNDNLYEKFIPSNSDDSSLVDSIKERGILEPLVISSDRVLLSGHRRLSAARYLKYESVPVRIVDIQYRSLSLADQHLLLSEFNQQREKSTEEKINEAFVRTDPDTASIERQIQVRSATRFKD